LVQRLQTWHGIIIKAEKYWHGACAQWVKPLLGHSACWAERLMALAGLGSNPGLKEVFFARLG